MVHIHKTSFLIYYCNILYNLCKLVEYIKLSFYDIYISQTLQFPMERYCPVKKIIFSNDLKLISFFERKKIQICNEVQSVQLVERKEKKQ